MSLSIQKMVSDGTLSTIVLGVQYLQRNDVYLRIAGVETPQSGAPSGYTWSFLDNNAIRVLPIVPAGVEVVVYRRTDLDAMYNVYSQNAQFDESTIDENNQQLLFIAQEYFEQGVPTQLISSVEYTREDTANMYYRLKLSDGSYTAEFSVPKGGAAGFEALRRSYADAGLTLVDGSFETGGTLTNGTDVLILNVTAEAYAWSGAFPKVVSAGSTPTPLGAGGWIDRSAVNLRGELEAGGASIADIAAAPAEIDAINQNLTDVDSETIYRKRIYVSPTINDPTANPPVYNSLAAAWATITDNDYHHRYTVEMLSGEHDANGILLKDYVDIIRSPSASSTVVIKHDFAASDSYKIRDIFKTANTPYDATDSFPIRCLIRGIYFKGLNLNYCIHSDFNDHPDIDITIEDCFLVNGDPASTATPSDYGVGIGIYGGQRLTFNNCRFYGCNNAALPIESRQGSGWIVHNRATQTRPCRVEFNNCQSLRGFYGGRVVDYGSTQEDIISINGGCLKGDYANLLCFSNGLPGTVTPSILVTGDVPITRVALQQQINSGGTVYKCEFPIAISGFSEQYVAAETLETGDIVNPDAYGSKVSKMLSTTRYKTCNHGVVLNPAVFGGRVSVQRRGIAAVKFSGAPMITNTEISNSSTENGKVQAAVTGDGILGVTHIGTAASTGITPGLAWVTLGYGGTK